MGRFQPNHAGIQALALGPEIRAVLGAKGEQAKSIAESLSEDFRVSGDYAEGFELEAGTRETGRNRRAQVTLVNTSDHAAAVEWGNARDHRPHRVLGRTLDQLGHE